MKYSPKNSVIIASLQFGILFGSFSLPNSIVNAATWYAPVIDFGRIALLFGFPVGDILLLHRFYTIGKRKKAQLRQFIDIEDAADYEAINPYNFVSLTPQQIDSIGLAFEQSRDDRILDKDFPFNSLQCYLQGSDKNV